ncbi:MAG: plasmid pRiA4b ORF-3 family protein [Nitrospira sp.]|nr:plasmid pRiA4b ORF-3 family protein [Nitrospira sp.]
MPRKPQPQHTVPGAGRGAGALLQFKITLTGIRPPIWRRVLVSEGLALSGLHDIIQEVMGWTNSHLHDFHWREDRFGVPDPEFDEERVVDERTVTLKELGLSVKDRLEYMYDFGDGWDHVLMVEQVLADGKHQTPVCLNGARSCPPEDCGGAWGYENLLEILKDPTHEEYEEWRTWLPEDFDPERFDLAEVNRGLSVRQWTIAPPSRKGRRKKV